MILLLILAAFLALEVALYVALLIAKELRIRRDDLEYVERQEMPVYPSPGVLAWMKRQDITGEG